jgi:hypothetical protein
MSKRYVVLVTKVRPIRGPTRGDGYFYQVLNLSEDLDGDTTYTICVECKRNRRAVRDPNTLVVVESTGKLFNGDSRYKLWRVVAN